MVFLHLKWFVSAEDLARMGAPSAYNPQDVWRAAAIAFGVYLILYIAHVALRNSKFLKKVRNALGKLKGFATPVLRTGTGLSLFISPLAGTFLAPDLPLPSGTAGAILAWFLLFTGLGFVLGLFVRLWAFVLIVLTIFGFFVFQPENMLNYIVFFGIGCYFLFVDDKTIPHPKIALRFSETPIVQSLKELEPFALPFARIVFGVTLVAQAFVEKILDPNMGMVFLGKYFSTVSPQWILVCGFVEFLLGLMLITAVLPRFAAAIIMLAFTSTFIALGIEELVGHLPLFAIAFLILVKGPGERLVAVK